MIKINGIKIEGKHFPDNTQLLNNIEFNTSNHSIFEVTWLYENDEEMITLMYLMKHYRNNYPVISKHYCNVLTMPYLPNARYDRTKSETEVFTLKHFCDFINDLKFDCVKIFDPHSDVGVGLLNNVRVIKPEIAVKNIIDSISNLEGEQPMLYFPDAGAKKRYSYIYEKLENKCDVCYGQKVREWKSGKILGLEIEHDTPNLIDLNGKTVIMIDDIISYGGTMYYSAIKLKEAGVKNIYIYCSHLENSVLDEEKGTLIKLLNDGTIKRVYTSNSLFTGKHNIIDVIQEF